jgi:hypothetical protein
VSIAPALGRAIALFTLAFAVAPTSMAAGRWWGGGGIGVAFGGDSDYVSVEPVLGYRVTEKLTVGGRVILRYRRDKRFDDELTTTDYGAALFTRYLVTDLVFVQGEYEYLNYEFRSLDGQDREGYDSLFAGAGLMVPIGRQARFFVSGLYNLLYDEDDRGPYAEPWVLRTGVGFRF